MKYILLIFTLLILNSNSSAQNFYKPKTDTLNLNGFWQLKTLSLSNERQAITIWNDTDSTFFVAPEDSTGGYYPIFPRSLTPLRNRINNKIFIKGPSGQKCFIIYDKGEGQPIGYLSKRSASSQTSLPDSVVFSSELTAALVPYASKSDSNKLLGKNNTWVYMQSFPKVNIGSPGADTNAWVNIKQNGTSNDIEMRNTTNTTRYGYILFNDAENLLIGNAYTGGDVYLSGRNSINMILSTSTTFYKNISANGSIDLGSPTAFRDLVISRNAYIPNKIIVGGYIDTNAQVSIFSTSPNPNLRLGYDATRYVDFLVNSSGDAYVSTQGSSGTIYFRNGTSSALRLTNSNAQFYRNAVADVDGTRGLGVSTLSWGSAYVNTYYVKSGTNMKVGTFTLASGTAIVSNTSITSNSQVILSPQGITNGGYLGVTYNAGVGFTVTSSNNSDARIVDYFIIERN